jgi:hypothetical protein
MEPPNREELDEAIGLLKRKKAAGMDNITPKLLNDGGENIRDWLLRICQKIWLDETTPEEWGKGINLPLAKK